jgi:hypothetical protein
MDLLGTLADRKQQTPNILAWRLSISFLRMAGRALTQYKPTSRMFPTSFCMLPTQKTPVLQPGIGCDSRQPEWGQGQPALSQGRDRDYHGLPRDTQAFAPDGAQPGGQDSNLLPCGQGLRLSPDLTNISARYR